jgi:hypothetical protein
VSAAVGVIARLEAVTAITALVSTRIYQGVFPQSPVLPAVRVQHIGEVRRQHLRGDAGVVVSRVQVDSVADGGNPITDAQAVDAAIVGDASGTALLGFKGDSGGVFIHNVEPAGEREFFDGEELRQYRVIRDVLVSWSQT